ncbi:MAG: phosphoglycolate phosphatase [Gammaproteobacteria bacterium]
MSLPKPELVVLDLDGTLVDSAPDLAYSIDTMLIQLGLPPQGEARVRTWIGSGAERLVKRALTAGLTAEPEEALFQTAVALFSDIYGQNTCRRSRLYPGVREGLDYLLATNRTLGCVTNKRMRFTQPLLKSLGIFESFAVVVAGDSLAAKKPDPLPLLHVANATGIVLEKCLMIGDSFNDVAAARAAGFSVFCVHYGYNNGKDIADTRPDAIINSLAELVTLI